MSDFFRASPDGRVGQTGRLAIDQGLRSYMLGVYNYMALGLVLTGLSAVITYAMAVNGWAGGHPQLTPFGAAIYASGLKYVVMLAPLAFILVLSFGINRLSASSARLLFFAYSISVGVSLSVVLLVYAHSTIAQAFFISAAAFGGMSIYGYLTQRDLSPMGSFLMIGLIGVILASVVSIFFHSTAFQFALAVITVLLFAGMTAWDTQNIKQAYFAGDTQEDAAKKSIFGALSLYLDFLNIFMSMLQIMGGQSSDE